MKEMQALLSQIHGHLEEEGNGINIEDLNKLRSMMKGLKNVGTNAKGYLSAEINMGGMWGGSDDVVRLISNLSEWHDEYKEFDDDEVDESSDRKPDYQPVLPVIREETEEDGEPDFDFSPAPEAVKPTKKKIL